MNINLLPFHLEQDIATKHAQGSADEKDIEAGDWIIRIHGWSGIVYRVGAYKAYKDRFGFRVKLHVGDTGEVDRVVHWEIPIIDSFRTMVISQTGIEWFFDDFARNREFEVILSDYKTATDPLTKMMFIATALHL